MTDVDDITNRLSQTSLPGEGSTGDDTSQQGSDRPGSKRSSSISHTSDTDTQNDSNLEAVPEPTPPGDNKQDSEITNGDKANTGKSPKVKNPFKSFIKRITSKHDHKESPQNVNQTAKLSKFDKVLQEVKVDSLPQVFVTKYMGFKPCHGLWGIKHTRGPVDDLISEITAIEPDQGEDLPLVQIRISLNGLNIKEHSANMCKSKHIAKETIPIEFISYGVQDIRYTRVFSFILVREMSSKSRKLECHAYVCDSTANCRKLSLSVAMAFQEYSKTLEGKPYKFQVDLRPSNELESELEEEEGGEDFEA